MRLARTIFYFARSVVAIVILAVSTVSISGCTPEARYEVLTFFFTGVPEPGTELDEGAKLTALGEKKVRAKKKKRRVFFQEPKFFVHGPYAARECEKCHTPDSSKLFKIGGVTSVTAAVSKKKNIGPRLAYPLEKLCFTCHSDKSDLFARSLNLSVHEPVATGMCIKCHNPHREARQYMLRGKNSIELCATACHAKDDFQKTKVHSKDKEKDCLECHNPHLGKTAKLLRSDYNEWQQFDGSN